MTPEFIYDPYAALKVPEFRLFVAGRFFATLALQAQAVAIGWQIYDLTKNPLSLGLTGLAEAVPSIVIALFAGYLADLISRKKIIVSCYFILAICSAILLTYAINPGNLIGSFGVYPIYSVVFISGIARGFIAPAVFSFMPQTLPSKLLYPNAVGWNITTWQAASVVGPAAGGLICGFFGVPAAYATALFLLTVTFFCYFRIQPRTLPTEEAGENAPTIEASIKDKLLTGLRFVFANKIILGAMSLDLFAVLFGGATALLPVFASDILNTGAQGLGFLRAAPAVGSILMNVYLTHHPIKKDAGKKMMAAVAGFGLCMILFGLSTSFYFSFVLLLFSGTLDSVSVFIRQTLMQILTPDSMKGRVSSVNNIFVSSSNEIGAFESGLAASLMGAPVSVIFGGIMTIIVVSITAYKIKNLRGLQL